MIIFDEFKEKPFAAFNKIHWKYDIYSDDSK